MQSASEHHQRFPLRIPKLPVTHRAFREWWNAESGYREVLLHAWPLFLSQGSSTILQFLDRMFLTWYSPEGMAAAGPSGMLAFSIQSLFIGLTGYASVFVAQYNGAGKPQKAIAAVWQAIYLAFLAELVILSLAPIGGIVFRLAGHSPGVQSLECSFFNVLIYGSFAVIGSAAISAYFIGNGMTRIVLWVNLLGVAINILLDYLLIFGHWGFPSLGITGAALATVTAQVVGLLIYSVVFIRESFAVHANGAWKPNLALMQRLFRYGMANGVQFFLDMVGWTMFLMLIGRLGVTALGASNLAFQINTFAFFPIIGFAMASSVLVGQNLGRNRPDLAERAIWSAIHIGLLFTGTVAIVYIAIPGWLIAPFGAEADPVAFAPVRDLTIIMLRFVAAYCMFDVGNLIFASALKGAGDTLYVMLLSSSITTILMLLPTLIWCIRPGGLGVLGAWGFLTLTVCTLAIAFLLRYLHGSWREMRVIEREVIE
jgi:MATE family multidrug resistance protein